MLLVMVMFTRGKAALGSMLGNGVVLPVQLAPLAQPAPLVLLECRVYRGPRAIRETPARRGLRDRRVLKGIRAIRALLAPRERKGYREYKARKARLATPDRKA